MSDENDSNDEEPQAFFAAVPIPAEMQAAIQAQHDHAQMHHNSTLHSLYGMFEDIKIEHLEQIKLIFHNLGDSPQALGYWEGVISSVIARRKDICIACGVNHEAQLQDMIAAQQAQPAATDEQVAAAQRHAQMIEYHVLPVLDGRPDGTVYCTGIFPDNVPCGMTYPNLADRMVKRPDECSGCFTRAGQG